MIDIGAYEDRNSAPTVLCPTPSTSEANSSAGLVATVTVQVTDAGGDGLDVILSVDGAPIQTNQVAFSGPSIPASVSLTSFFGLGPHSLVSCQ